MTVEFFLLHHSAFRLAFDSTCTSPVARLMRWMLQLSDLLKPWTVLILRTVPGFYFFIFKTLKPWTVLILRTVPGFYFFITFLYSRHWSRGPCSFFALSPAFTFLYSKLKTVPPPFGFRGLGPRLHPFNLFFKNWRSIIIWVMRTMSTSQTSPRVPVGPIFRPGSSHNNIMRSRCFHAADEAFFFLLPDYFPASFLFYLFFVYSFL